MAESSLTLIVSTGIGISVIAGILSGVCYVIAHGLQPKKYRKERVLPWRCIICNCNLAGTSAKFIRCSLCQQKACKHRCAQYDQINHEWICLSCHPSWLRAIFQKFNKRHFFQSTRQPIKAAMENELPQRRETKDDCSKEYVRDFIERLVAAMLGGDVDDASVTRMYTDKQYVSLFDKYHEDLCNALTDLGSALHISITNLPALGQSPCNAHANLKQIIGNLLKESLQISDLSELPQPQSSPGDETNQTYEQLLATAILNKVVNHSQYDTAPGSSSSSTQPQKEYFFADEKLDEKYSRDFESSSASSLNELQSDSSLGSTKYVDQLSLTIQQRIEETEDFSDYETNHDDIDNFRPQSSSSQLDDGSNWYLQRRQLFTTSSPVPVPMLVPSPTTESKVLIGDQDIDETSDLSDTASDFGDLETVPAGINSLIVESKTIIGGKNVISSFLNSTDDVSDDSGVKTVEVVEEEEEKIEKSDIRIDDDNVDSLESQHSNIERDVEYMEKYESLPRTIEKSTNLVYTQESDDSDYGSPSFEGSYSRREKEKWKNPIEMKNNPYTEENIRKRHSEGYGRDYYKRMASRPGGSHKAEDNSWISNEEEVEDNNLHKAVPILIETTSDSDVNENEQEKQIEPTSITSDSDLSTINFYDVEKSTIVRKLSTTNQEEVVGIAINPLTQDENGNDISTPKPKPRTFTSTNNQPSSFNNIAKIVSNKNKPPEMRKATSLFDVTAMVVDDEPQFKFMNEHPAFQRSKSEISYINNPMKKKADNTLLRKIYANPTVRSFALTQRNSIPIDMETKETKEVVKVEERPQPIIKIEEIVKEPVKIEKSKDWENVESRNEDDIDIRDLPDAGIVNNRVELFSKPKEPVVLSRRENDSEDVPHTASVRELRKKFDALATNNSIPITSSLTARRKRVYQPVPQ